MIYSNSQLQTFKDCQLRYNNRYNWKLRKIEEEEEAHHRRFGDAIHQALETVYKGDSVEAGLSRFRAVYHTQLDPEDKAKTQANGEILLKSYFNRYAKEDSETLDIVSVEEMNELEVGGVKMRVKIDLVIRHKKLGGIFAFDHKTTGKSFGRYFWNQFDINSQLDCDTYYLQQQYGECSGCIINGLSFGFRLRKYKDKPAGFHFDFQRQMFVKNQRQVDAWKDSLAKTVADIEESRRVNQYSMNTQQCTFCDYNNLCRAGLFMPDDEDTISVQYERKE